MEEPPPHSKILAVLRANYDLGVELRPVTITNIIPKEQRQFEIYWYESRQAICTSEQELLNLEKILEREHGISSFDKLILGGRALVLVSGDKVIQLSQEPLRATRGQSHVASFPEANPLLAQGAGGDELHYAIFKYLPREISDARQIAASQASLYTRDGYLYGDPGLRNYRIETQPVELFDEHGRKDIRQVDIPRIIDVEGADFIVPFWSGYTETANAPFYLSECLAMLKSQGQPNSVVSTPTHEVFFFEDKKLFDMFQSRIGKENCRDGTVPPDGGEKSKASVFHLPAKGERKEVYILSMPREMAVIPVGHDKSSHAGPFSLRLLMEEIMRAENNRAGAIQK